MVVVLHKYALGDHFMVPWVLDYEDRSFLYCYGPPFTTSWFGSFFSAFPLYTSHKCVWGQAERRRRKKVITILIKATNMKKGNLLHSL